MSRRCTRIADRLPRELTEELVRHGADCPDCGAQLAAHRALSEQLAVRPLPELSPGFERRLARAHAERRALREGGFGLRRGLGRGLGRGGRRLLAVYAALATALAALIVSSSGAAARLLTAGPQLPVAIALLLAVTAATAAALWVGRPRRGSPGIA